MGSIDQNHLLKIEKYLDEQGLTFKPLREEMLDHILSDLEGNMEQGKTFEEAWTMISGAIPHHHFKSLQTETMETINKRFNISKGLTYLAILLLAATSIFKLLHFPGTGYLLIASLVAMGIALLVSSISGIYLHREKKGQWLMMGMIFGILLFITSWMFAVLHLPGRSELLLGSVTILLILFPFLTLYFNSHLKSENNILTYLHEKHIPGIERFLFILLGLAVSLRISSIVFDYPPNVSMALLVLVIFGAGLQYFALTWHPKTSNFIGNNKWAQVLIIISFACFLLPALPSYLSLPVRVTLGTLFFIIAGWLSVRKLTKNYTKVYFILLIGLIILHHIGWWMIEMNVVNSNHSHFFFNLPFALILLVGLIFSQKHSLIKVYLTIVLAHYFLEYPVGKGLW